MARFYTFAGVAAIAIAWAAAMIHRSGHAPLGLVSLGVGIALGAALRSIAATLRVAGQRPLMVTTLVLALLTVITQHAWLYAHFRREWQAGRENSPQIKLFRDESPWSPWQYIAHEATPQRIALWCVDAALITTSACGTVWLTRRRAQPGSAIRPTPKTLNPEP
jgi:hypothetical protein